MVTELPKALVLYMIEQLSTEVTIPNLLEGLHFISVVISCFLAIPNVLHVRYCRSLIEHQCIPSPRTRAGDSNPRATASQQRPLLPSHHLLQTDNLSTFPSLSLIQLNPAIDRASLHTDHLLVPLRRRKICHVLPVRPWIPNDYLGQIVPYNAEYCIPAFSDGDGFLWATRWSVDAVGD